MDIQQIRYFSDVYESCNYARSADRLCISRQALRKAIHKLEREVGTPLFENDANRLRPTEAAHRLYRSSRAALRGFSEIEACVAQIKLSGSETVRYGQSIGSSDVFSSVERMAFSRMPIADNPISARIHVREGSCRDIREMLLAGELDYATIVATSINDALFDSCVAREGRIHLAVNASSPLAARETVSVQDLDGLPLATQGPGYDVHDLLSSAAAAAGFSLHVVMEVGDVHGALYSVESGTCATYTYSARTFPKVAPDVVCVPFEEPAMTWRFCSLAKKGMGDPYMLRYFAGKVIDWDAFVSKMEGSREG